MLTDTMILQGPPGTGKTFMIAELCAKLCAEGHSVLITALTNRALMEIAEKPSVESLLNEHKIYKTNITIDEMREIGKLETIKTSPLFQAVWSYPHIILQVGLLQICQLNSHLIL